MKGWFKKETIDGRECLVPTDEHTAEGLHKLKPNHWLQGEIKTPRNYKHTAKYYCLIAEIVPHCDHSKDELDELIRFYSGHYTILGEVDGVKIAKAKRLSFAKMTQTEFEDYYERALDVMIGDKLGLSLTKEQIDDLAEKAYRRMEKTYGG